MILVIAPRLRRLAEGQLDQMVDVLEAVHLR
jgi:hypothetical protein